LIHFYKRFTDTRTRMSKKESLLKFWESIESHQHTKEPIEIIKPRSPYRNSVKTVAPQTEPLSRSQAKDLSPKQKSVSAKVKLVCWGGDRTEFSKEGGSPSYNEKTFPFLSRNEVLPHLVKSRAKRTKKHPTRKKTVLALTEVGTMTPPAAKDEFAPVKSPPSSVLGRRASFSTFHSKQIEQDKSTAVPFSPKSNFTVSKAAITEGRNSLHSVKSSLAGISALNAATTPSIAVTAVHDVKSPTKLTTVATYTVKNTPRKAFTAFQDVKSPKNFTSAPKRDTTPSKAFHELKSPLKPGLVELNATSTSPFKAALTAFQDVKSPVVLPPVSSPFKPVYRGDKPSKVILPSDVDQAPVVTQESRKNQMNPKSGDDLSFEQEAFLAFRSEYDARIEKLELDLENEKSARNKLEREVQKLREIVTKLTNLVGE